MLVKHWPVNFDRTELELMILFLIHVCKLKHNFSIMKPSTIIVLIVLTFLSWQCKKSEKVEDITTTDILAAEKLAGLYFTKSEHDSMNGLISTNKDYYLDLRDYKITNDIPPALVFNPVPQDFVVPDRQLPMTWKVPYGIQLPDDENELAFYSLPELAALLQAQKISSVELTRFFIERLKKFGDTLQCVVSLTEEYALEQAGKMDEEIRSGHYRGILHGIPYGIKDLFAFPGYPTTWGAGPYKDQYLDEKASVISKLEDAGAVLVAKLTLGSLAMGDVWFGGVTRNPWNLRQGSSGSSAGSAAATVAGLVPFAIGTETWGSIVSPSTRCGATGLRPTFGRVSRTGAMALSWSMDKVGPICRDAYDCAIVFNAIRGTDNTDQSVIDAPFNYQPAADLAKLRIGYLKDLFDSNYVFKSNDSLSLLIFRQLGADLMPVSLPDSLPVQALSIILFAEAAAAFDELTRSDRDSLLTEQHRDAWPNYFRSSRFIPAVEYIQANRIRQELIRETNLLFRDFDVIIAPSFVGDQLLLTNLTGHPCVVLPDGFTAEGAPASISLLGNLFDEATILSVAVRFQEATDFEDRHPPLFEESE
jgi:Asp-tRNA(Asn)/Glu-tRNA(Gln) amidotransferase A subunit family amidase